MYVCMYTHIFIYVCVHTYFAPCFVFGASFLGVSYDFAVVKPQFLGDKFLF